MSPDFWKALIIALHRALIIIDDVFCDYFHLSRRGRGRFDK
jgi:hypothetical protein